MPTVHVRFLKLQKISATLGETPFPCLPFSFLVERLEASPEGENHDAQPIGRDTNTVRVSASLTSGLGPDVRTIDITQPTKRVDESDGYRSLRGRAGERGAEDRAIRNLKEHHFEPSIERRGPILLTAGGIVQ